MNYRLLVTLISLSANIFLCSCIKEEIDVVIPNNADVTKVTGRIVTTDGVGLPNIKLDIRYSKSTTNIITGSLSRLKASATTDKNGAYSLSLYLRDDELTFEEDYSKGYHIIYDFSSLDNKKYVMPKDLGHSGTFFTSYVSLKRDTTYQANFYVPRKRCIPVTLKGYKPSAISSFIVYTTMPWGNEKDNSSLLRPEEETIDSKWTESSCPIGAFSATHDDITFTNIPFALNDTTIVTLWRIKEDGTGSFEHIKMHVSDTKPKSLSFDF